MRPGGQRLMGTRLGRANGRQGKGVSGGPRGGTGWRASCRQPKGKREGARGIGGAQGGARGGEGREGPGQQGLRCRRQPGCADSRSPTSRIRTSFFMSAARRGRARPACMERTPLAGSAHPKAPLSPRCLPASPAAPPEPGPPGPAAPPSPLLTRSRAGTQPAPPPPAPRAAVAAAAAAAGSTGRREGQVLSERERERRSNLRRVPASPRRRRAREPGSRGASPTLCWEQMLASRFEQQIR